MPGTNDRQKKRPARARLPLRPAVLGIAGLVLVSVLAVLILHIPTVQKEIISRAVNRIEAATQLKVELASYRWLPFSGLSLAGVKVSSEERTILDCEKVGISYNLSLDWPYVRVEEVYLEKPFLQLEKSEGKWRVPGKFPGQGQGGGEVAGDPVWMRFPLPRLRFVSGVVEGRQDGKTVLSIKDFTGALNLKTVQGPHGPEIRLDLDNWRAGTMQFAQAFMRLGRKW